MDSNLRTSLTCNEDNEFKLHFDLIFNDVTSFFLSNILKNQPLNYIVLLYSSYLQLSRLSKINNYFIIKILNFKYF